MNDVYSLVRSLREARWPRNRHFEAHATPAGKRARRIHRFLRALERDLLRADAVSVQPHTSGVTLEMTFAAVRSSRRVQLSRHEHALLAEDPRLASRLQVA